MEIKGQVRKIGETTPVGSGGFTKRELVITTDEQYPQHILVEFFKDKCSLLDGIEEGQDLTVSINLRGREWTSPDGEVKYFNSIVGWRIEKGVFIGTKIEPTKSNPVSVSSDDDQEPPF